MIHVSRRVVRAAVATLLLASAALGAAACSGARDAAVTPTSSTTMPAPTQTAPALTTPLPPPDSARPVTIAVLGDSNTTGFSGTLEAGVAAGTAWVTRLPAEFTVVGGWAVDGSTASAIADAAVEMPDVELVIVMAGTNDIATGVPTEITLNEIARIADAVGAQAMAVCAIPPLGWSPRAAQELNSALEAHAEAHGWLFIDPWVEMRNPDGTWVAAYETDGVHTSAEGYAAAGDQIGAQLREWLP
jgi:lysophospholipase L1-like esterase